MLDLVEKPAHYQGAGLETIDVIEDWVADPGAHLGTAIKYLCRAGRKGGNPAVQDLRKARWYVARADLWIARGGRVAAWSHHSGRAIEPEHVRRAFGLDGNVAAAVEAVASALSGPTFCSEHLEIALIAIDATIAALTVPAVIGEVADVA